MLRSHAAIWFQLGVIGDALWRRRSAGSALLPRGRSAAGLAPRQLRAAAGLLEDRRARHLTPSAATSRLHKPPSVASACFGRLSSVTKPNGPKNAG